MSLLPFSAEASIFSFVTNLFSQSAAAETASVVNSQTMPLLESVRNPNPDPAKGGGDITIVGDTALLPESGPSGTIVDIQATPASDQISIYVVRPGDTLSAIAKMYGVSVNTIVWANDIQGGVIQPGQTLVILPISGIQHKVAKGETLKSIAAKYKADVNEIIQFNNLSQNETLAVDTTIIIPDGEAETAVRHTGYPKVTSPLRHAGGPVYELYYTPPLAEYVKTQGLHGYNAVDLGAPVGTPILAAAAGEVIVSKNYGWNGGYGEYVVISHNNGTQTLYAHMSENITYPGMRVFRGQVIGYVGATGKATGPHLHYEVRGATNPLGP